MVPITEGRLLASGIPDAEFIELDSGNHILLEHEPAWQRFCDEVLAFLQPGQLTGDSVFAALSARERQVLALMADGLSNAGIAERLQISERPSATTRRICSTSSACGRGRRRSSSHASAATRAEPPTNRIGAR